jgi:glycerol-3-phosphate acyltransferase PlsX
MRIAVDAMGGDYAPEVVVQGAIDASSKLDIEVLLVGDKDSVAEALDKHPSQTRVSLYHCTESIGMDESPFKSVRQKRDSSIRIAFELVQEGEADAVVSAGNSGAILAAGVLTLGRLKGVQRPAIASILHGENGEIVIIDVGANVDCRPSHLLQFGVMAHAFAVACLEIPDPNVGLLNIGAEAGKGNEQVRLAQELFRESHLNFIGNVEGGDIFGGDVDVVVCDGFVGNILLKMSEGLADMITRLVKKELIRSTPTRITGPLGKRHMSRLMKRLEYEEYGGAPLLGINGVGIVCHGASSSRAIMNAIELAWRFSANRVIQKMVSELDLYRAENDFSRLSASKNH